MFRRFMFVCWALFLGCSVTTVYFWTTLDNAEGEYLAALDAMYNVAEVDEPGDNDRMNVAQWESTQRVLDLHTDRFRAAFFATVAIFLWNMNWHIGHRIWLGLD